MRKTKIYGNAAFPTYTERVKFGCQSRKTATNNNTENLFHKNVNFTGNSILNKRQQDKNSKWRLYR